MQNGRKRIVASFILSLLFYSIWIFYDVVVYWNLSIKSLFGLIVLCISISAPCLLFMLFFSRNEFKIMSDEVASYIEKHLWIHVISSVLTILTSVKSDLIFLYISFSIKMIAIVLTYIYDKKIYEKTMELHDVDEKRKAELILQDATLAGTAALIFSGFMLGAISLVGKDLIVFIVIIPFLIFILSCNYLKYQLVASHNIVNCKKGIIYDSTCIVLSAIMTFIFSDGKSINIFVIILCVLVLWPMLKNNKIIANEWKRIKNSEECNKIKE